MGSKQATATSTNTSEPWAEQKPYLQQIMGQAQQLYQSNGPQYYPKSTVAPFSKPQLQAQQAGMNRAMQGSGALRGANQYASDVMGGKYLNDPYNDQVFNSIQSKIMPAVNSNFAAAGRYGSGAHTGAMTTALTDAYAPYASQMRQGELDRMSSMASFAPELAQADYNDINAMYDIGSQQQMMAQSEMDDAKGRWDYYQDLPFNKLSQYLGLIGGNYGGQTTSAQPYYKPSGWAQAAGIGASLLGAFI